MIVSGSAASVIWTAISGFSATIEIIHAANIAARGDCRAHIQARPPVAPIAR
jgi:hypothetical protein